MIRIRRSVGAVAVFAGTALTSVLTPGAAHAAYAPGVVHYTTSFQLDLQAPTAATTTITCTSDIEYAHGSHHVPDTVNVRAWVDCTAPVTYLAVDVKLYFENVKMSEASDSNWGNRSEWMNTSYACIPGYWHGDADIYITFPPTFVPPSAQHYEISPPQLITCT